ncbi:MAG: O-antigen ligase domain-containing protein [Tepidisphaeraceae bacterium]|jgi:hypothetical protein
MDMRGNILVPIALFGWIPLVLGLFAFLPPRRAVIYGFLIAWLFLPMSHLKIQGFTDYNKMSAACFGVLISAMIFDSATLFAFRPKIWDLPMLIWCICPLFSSVSNGLGWYDGISAVAYQTTFWGLPYLIGRMYFNDLVGLRELAMGILIGGLVYVPLCWYEIRFSPQLHRIVYGYHQFEFAQTKRYGGFRPMVFMQHGLAVGLWMAAATLTAFWLYLSKTIRRLWELPMGLVFVVLLATSVWCHSTGSVVLLLGGLAVVLLTQWTRWPVWVIALALAPTTYMIVRGNNLWTGQDLIKSIARADPDRAASLRVRLQSERLLLDRAMQRPDFGWGGWNRFRQYDEEGNAQGVPDALWIIAVGHHGLVGLISLTACLTLPLLLLVWKIPVRYWLHPGAAPAAAIAMLCALYMCDNLMNAMINPIFILGAGGICGLALSLRRPLPAPARPQGAAPLQAPALPPGRAHAGA